MSKRNVFLLGTVLLIALGFALFQAVGARAESLPWSGDYNASLQQSRARHLPLVVYLHTDWCAFCRQMERQTFADPNVVDHLSDKYVWVRLDAEKDPEGIRLNQKFGITGYPTLVVVDSEGEEVDRLNGFIMPGEFETSLGQILKDPDSFGRLRQRALKQPSSPKAHYELAHKLLDRARFQDAWLHFSRVITLDPDNHQGLTDWSHVYGALALASEEKASEALQQLSLMEARFPKSEALGDAAFLRGQIYYFTGQHSEARQALGRYLEKYPQNTHNQQARDMLKELE